MCRNLIVAAAVSASALVLAVPAQAQATRTWVSGVGDDVNPCSRTAPCKTFAGAISKTAPAGIISVLDPGGFGTVTITKSITIDGGGIVGSILGSLTTGVIINAAATDDVWLRHLSIDGAGNGIAGIRVMNNTGSVHIDDVSITDVTGRCIDVSAVSANIYITNTHATACAGGALYVQNARATVDNFTSEGSQYGVRVGPAGIATVKHSSATGGSVGFAAANDPSAVLNLDDSVTSHNDFGIVASQGATVRCTGVTVMSNRSIGVFNDGASTLVSFGNNFVVGNPTNGSFSTGVAPQ
jgi:hypothetical protein